MKATVTKFNAVPFVIATAVFLILWIIFFHGMMYDDSYIAFRYSENWAAGHGPVWNIGENPVEGFTSFAWVAIGALIKLIGLPLHDAMRWAGVLAWFAATALLIPSLAAKIDFHPNKPGVRPSAAAMILVFLTLAGNAAIGFQAFHGLETSLFSLAILLFIFQALRSRSLKDHLILGGLALFVFMVRPDGAAIIVPVWLVLILLSPIIRKNVLAGVAAGVLLIGLYTAAKWAYFGYPFPNTFYIKESTQELAGQSYVIEYLSFISPLLAFMIYSAGRIRLVRMLKDKTFMILILPAMTFSLAYIGIDPILGNIHRFLIPTLPLFVLAALRVHVAAKTAHAETTDTASITEGYVLFSVALILVNVLFNIKVVRNYAFLQNYLGVSDATRQQRGLQLQAANQLDPAPLLATGDVGALPYFSGLPTMDIIGLSDEVIAHEGLSHEYALSRNPDLLILQDFYYTGSDHILACGPQGYENPTLLVKGKEVSLNLTRYTKVLETPAIAHNGKGSTYQIVTMPGFAETYVHITFWDFGGDQYHLFVRRDYPQFDALVQILTAGGE